MPHKGWICVDVEDLGEPSATCEMCETVEIRFVHRMQHPEYADVLGVGCVCAEHMSEDYTGPRERERALRSLHRRKARWLKRRWTLNRDGDSCLRTDGFVIVLLQHRDRTWGARITDEQGTRRTHSSRRKYTTEQAAALAAFDAMIVLKHRRAPTLE